MSPTWHPCQHILLEKKQNKTQKKHIHSTLRLLGISNMHSEIIFIWVVLITMVTMVHIGQGTWPRAGGYSAGIWVGGFGRLNETLTLFTTQKMYVLLPCLRESAVISYPVQDWTKHFIFHAFQRRRTKSAKINWSKGEKRRRFVGTSLFKTGKCEIV